MSGSYNGGAGGFTTELRSGVDAAPVPQVTSRPAAEVQPRTWQAPSLGASGHFAVHRDHLPEAASIVRSRLGDVREAIAEVQQYFHSFDCMAGWPQGQQMMQNLMTLLDAFASVSKDTHDAHALAAGKFKASYDAYEQAEQQSKLAAERRRYSGVPKAPDGQIYRGH